MGSCCGVHCSRRNRDLLPSPRQVFVGVGEEFQLNRVLNRWRSGEVTLLQRKFREAREGTRGLTRENLLAIFHLEAHEELVGDGLVQVFRGDNGENKATGSLNNMGLSRRLQEVDFKDFCRGLALCCRGTRSERLRFLFDLFSGSDQPKNLGYKPSRSKLKVRKESLSEDVGAKKEEDSELELSSTAMAASREEKKLPVLSSNAADALANFCKVEGSKPTPADLDGYPLNKFFEWADQGGLSDDKLEDALAPFYLLPSPQMEKQGFINAIKDCKYKEGMTLHLVSFRWWIHWVRYIGLSQSEENQLLHLEDLVNGGKLQINAPISPGSIESSSEASHFNLSINSPERSQGAADSLASSFAENQTGTGGRPNGNINTRRSATMKTASMRPDEINNTDLQGLAEWELKENLQVGLDFVVWPKAGWTVMSEWYGGGPSFERKVVRAQSNENDLEIDLYPVALSVNSCDVVGKPGLIEKLMLVSKRELLGKAAADICHSWHIKFNEDKKKPHQKSASQRRPNEEGKGVEEEDLPPPASLTTIEKNVRVWTFDLDRTQALREDEQEEGNTNEETGNGTHDSQNTANEDNQAQRQQNAVSVQSVGRWELLPTVDFKSTMQALEFRSGQRLMLEIRLPNGDWPRDRYIEPQDFREFSNGDRVDAMDYRGRWYTGSIVTVESGSKTKTVRMSTSKNLDPVNKKRVRVHFDRFASKWDEWYEVNSSRLAPEGSYTAVAPPLDQNDDEEQGDSTNMDKSKGSKGKSKKSPKSMSESSSSKRILQNQPSDGINNYNNVSINRRSHTMGQPPVPGACGLVNMGNTCFLNSALQCLSHTPLLRAYLLSGLYEPEINSNNPLGTQGQLIEQFAGLLTMLWSDEYLCVLPSKFRRTLSKFKQQFSGNDQQDSQEFLAEMLDSLHEDVNRVLKKPYVPALEDHEIEGKSEKKVAQMFWDRHLLRNRSVIVDLFQGQIKVEVTCLSCEKRSVNFDPFMYLSVPIPSQMEKPVEVTLIRRVRQGISKEDLMPMRFGLRLPRLGEISDLKKALSDICKVPKEKLTVTDVYRHKFHKIFEDSEPLALIRDDDVIVAYEKTRHVAPSEKESGSTPKASGSRSTRSKSGSLRNKSNTMAESESLEALQKKGVEDEDSEMEFDEPGSGPKSVLAPQEFPKAYGELSKGLRLDAIDHRGHWYSGTVVDILKGRVRVHFDRFSSKWDEWYSEQDWADGRLRPLHTKVAHARQTIEVQLFHRRPVASANSKNKSWGSPRSSLKSVSKELFGVPLLIHCDGEKSVSYFYQLVLQQVSRFLKPSASLSGEKLLALVKKGEERLWSATSRLPFTLSFASIHNPAGDLTAATLTPDPHSPIVSTISNKMAVVVDWHEASQYDPSCMHWVDHSSYTELNDQAAQKEARGEGVTMAACLNQFTKEETLDENDSWYCGKCKTHRRCRMRTMLWTMPDILVISVKRFHCSARWREKIRTLVYFPQSGFDTSSWVCEDSDQSREKGSLVYDLYGVVNHVGGMTGGHYTAFCRSSTCTKEGVEEVGTGGSGGPWLHFDDEFVEEISPDKIVSEAAYVLFYRKRRITPSNVITMTV